MLTAQISLTEKQLETVVERAMKRVLRSQKYTIPLAKELQWIQEGETALKKGKRYTDVKKLMADALR